MTNRSTLQIAVAALLLILPLAPFVIANAAEATAAPDAATAPAATAAAPTTSASATGGKKEELQEVVVYGMKTYLGVDGGGSKTLFLLIDEQGQVLGTHTEGPAYHLEIGLESLEAMLSRGIGSTLQKAGMAPSELTFAFLGVPAYGEDRSLQARLDAAPAAALPAGRYRCGNDVVCGWAGALAGADGINIVAGTGSIAYGEYSGRSARAGGWGERFSDEGSAHWLAREGLRLFSRMP